MKFKWLGTVALAIALCFVSITDAQSGSSKPGGGSSRPSTSSRPPSSSRPSAPPSTSKPKFGPTTSPKPATPPSSNPSAKPKFGPTTPPPAEKPKFGPGTTSGNPNSSKPGSSGGAKAQENKAQASKNAYVEQQRAQLPPKKEYTTPDGKTVKVGNEAVVNKIRNQPSSYYHREVREVRYVNHTTVYHYHHPYSYYSSQPVIYVGGGYNSAFWWMMMEWSAERRAMWLYHNQYNISADAYAQGVRDAQVAAQLQRMKTSGINPNPNYIDPEFSGDPSIMYTDAHLQAMYPPVSRPATAAERAAGAVILWIFVGFLAVAALIGLLYLLTQVKFKS
jgi:hypothetical protein